MPVALRSVPKKPYGMTTWLIGIYIHICCPKKGTNPLTNWQQNNCSAAAGAPHKQSAHRQYMSALHIYTRPIYKCLWFPFLAPVSINA